MLHIAARQNAGHGVIADRMLAEGQRLMEAGHPIEALRLLEAGNQAAPSASGWRALAEVRLDMRHHADAKLAAEAALELEPGCHVALTLRARAHGMAGDTRAALSDAADAVHAAPRDGAARTALAQALLAGGHHDEAIAILGEVWSDAPHEPAPALRLADAFLRAGHTAPAEELITFLLAQPELPAAARRQAIGMRAQAAMARGAADEALAAARSGLDLFGADAGLHSMAAHALMRLNDMENARPHLLAAHRLAPQDGYIAHLAATFGAAQPERAADAYVAHLFNGYAPGFEASLLGLGYRAPGLMLRALEELRPGLSATQPIGDVLDLGCGTGLVGVVLHDVQRGRMVGVDLSAGMLRAAAQKGIYSELREAGLDAALAEDRSLYDAVIAADVFCYFGKIAPSLAMIAPRLAPGGICLFTLEEHAGPEAWLLAGSGRYRHSEAALRAALTAAGLDAVILRREALRLEKDAPVQGFLVAARRAGGRA